MSQENGIKMTLVDLLWYLRQQLQVASEQTDKATVANLLNTLGLIVEATEENHDRELASLVGDMEDSARDLLMGVASKSDPLPSLETIQAAVLATV